jgi:hypothetical protein
VYCWVTYHCQKCKKKILCLATILLRRIYVAENNKTLFGLHVECQCWCPIATKLDILTYLHKSAQYQISRKSYQWGAALTAADRRAYRRTDGRTWRIYAPFREYVNTPIILRHTVTHSFFRRYNFNLWMFWPLSTYNFHLLRSWMQLVQFFIFNFFMSFLCRLRFCSLVSLAVLLTSDSTYIF